MYEIQINKLIIYLYLNIEHIFILFDTSVFNTIKI